MSLDGSFVLPIKGYPFLLKKGSCGHLWVKGVILGHTVMHPKKLVDFSSPKQEANTILFPRLLRLLSPCLLTDPFFRL